MGILTGTTTKVFMVIIGILGWVIPIITVEIQITLETVIITEVLTPTMDTHNKQIAEEDMWARKRIEEGETEIQETPEQKALTEVMIYLRRTELEPALRKRVNSLSNREIQEQHQDQIRKEVQQEIKSVPTKQEERLLEELKEPQAELIQIQELLQQVHKEAQATLEVDRVVQAQEERASMVRRDREAVAVEAIVDRQAETAAVATEDRAVLAQEAALQAAHVLVENRLVARVLQAQEEGR